MCNITNERAKEIISRHVPKSMHDNEVLRNCLIACDLYLSDYQCFSTAEIMEEINMNGMNLRRHEWRYIITSLEEILGVRVVPVTAQFFRSSNKARLTKATELMAGNGKGKVTKGYVLDTSYGGAYGELKAERERNKAIGVSTAANRRINNLLDKGVVGLSKRDEALLEEAPDVEIQSLPDELLERKPLLDAQKPKRMLGTGQ